MTKIAKIGILFMTQRTKKPYPLAESTPSVALHHLFKIAFHQLIPSSVLFFVADAGVVYICFSLPLSFFLLLVIVS